MYSGTQITPIICCSRQHFTRYEDLYPYESVNLWLNMLMLPECKNKLNQYIYCRTERGEHFDQIKIHQHNFLCTSNTDDSACNGSIKEVRSWCDQLAEQGPVNGYFPEPTKNCLIISLQFENEARLVLVIWVCRL